MISVLVFRESRYPVDREKIKKFVEKYLENKIKGAVEVGVSIIGDRKMKQLNSKYRSLHQTTDVLSFPLDDATVSSRADIHAGFSPEKSAPDKILRLGDVVVSYPQAVLEAAEENRMVDFEIEKLITHGLEHLLGNHHPE